MGGQCFGAIWVRDPRCSSTSPLVTCAGLRTENLPSLPPSLPPGDKWEGSNRGWERGDPSEIPRQTRDPLRGRSRISSPSPPSAPGATPGVLSAVPQPPPRVPAADGLLKMPWACLCRPGCQAVPVLNSLNQRKMI